MRGRGTFLVLLGLATAGCMQGFPAEPPPEESDAGTPSEERSTGTSPATPAATTGGSPSTSSTTTDPCTPEAPCEIPEMDPDSPVQIRVNASYASGTVATIRLRNAGDRAYVYSTTQASCDLGIYADDGRRVSQGICSDAYFYGRLDPGQETEYWRWGLGECAGGGPWYGGCDDYRPVPPGTYHLRQAFCPSDGPGQTSHPDAPGCVRAGATLQVV